MQHGGQPPAIVKSMQGLSAYRGSYATYCKRRAHQTHRSRVRRDLKLIAREAADDEAFEPGPDSPTEHADSWDIL